jgi:hypothetical protein
VTQLRSIEQRELQLRQQLDLLETGAQLEEELFVADITKTRLTILDLLRKINPQRFPMRTLAGTLDEDLPKLNVPDPTTALAPLSRVPAARLQKFTLSHRLNGSLE